MSVDRQFTSQSERKFELSGWTSTDERLGID